jgi:tRNA G10  N-methylase Trm11
MQYKSLCILGRLPALGRAELESIYGPHHWEPIGDHVIASDLPHRAIDFVRLGGSVRLAEYLTTLPTTKWSGISQHLIQAVPDIVASFPEGKLKLGVSAFDLSINARHLLRAGLELKKACRQAGRSARLVPNEQVELSSAQVLHNQLTSNLGLELLLIRHNDQTIVARTVVVQDITAYAARDQHRPKRDARVGMLPPKLAQTIVNLAVATAGPRPGDVVLDPFCGTGVILQEATLMGFDIYGSDLEPRMVEYSDHNLKWLQQHTTPSTETQSSNDRYYKLEVGDATTHQWQPVPHFVACETYLGRPLSGWPNPEKLQEIIGTCNVIIEKFMRNIAGQLKPGTRLCIAVPAWHAPNGRVYHLPLLDRLEDLGYNRVSFEHAQASELHYSRPDQIVGRELLVITRK